MKNLFIAALALFMLTACTKDNTTDTSTSTTGAAKDPNEISLVQETSKLENEKGEIKLLTNYDKSEEAQNILKEISQNKDFNMSISLNQTLFLPLELILDKYKDDNFIEILKTLVGAIMNTDNILHIYDYLQYIKSPKD